MYASFTLLLTPEMERNGSVGAEVTASLRSIDSTPVRNGPILADAARGMRSCSERIFTSTILK